VRTESRLRLAFVRIDNPEFSSITRYVTEALAEAGDANYPRAVFKRILDPTGKIILHIYVFFVVAASYAESGLPQGNLNQPHVAFCIMSAAIS
jgi:hypothetical protein